MKSLRSRWCSTRLIIGISLVLIGILFLAFNFGWLPLALKPIVFSWQMLLIAIGIGSLMKRKLFSGLILLSVGLFFIYPKVTNAFPEFFLDSQVNFVQIYWPLLIILCGCILIFYRIFKPRKKKCHHSRKHFNYANELKGVPLQSEYFSKDIVFGGGEYIILNEKFKGAELQVVFGSVRLDLRNTEFIEKNIELKFSCVFGEVMVLLPIGWDLEIHTDEVFSGVEDRRMQRTAGEGAHKLIIRGEIVFGSFVIKD